VLQTILPPSVRQVNPAVHVVAAAAQALQLLGIQNALGPQSTQFYVSGCAAQFAQVSMRWLGYIPVVEQVSLPVVSVNIGRAARYTE